MITRALSVARVSLALLLGLLVVLAATGWLYVVQPATPFPGGWVADALPLDELSRHSAAPLVVYAGVWTLAALALGCLVRFARARRVPSALLLALGVGSLSFLAQGVSLLTVRQVPAHEAFVAAAQLRAVYLPALLAGLAGALFGRPSAGRGYAPLVLAWLVAAVGLLGVGIAILPRDAHGWVENLAPQAVHPVTSALAAPLGVVLLLLARGLARRSHRAWQLAVALLAASAALHLFHGAGYGASAAGVVLLVLVARRRDFDAPGDPAAPPRVLLRLGVAAGVIAAYGAAALWVNRAIADQPYTLGFALRETGLALVGVYLRGSPHVSGEFGAWFPLSVLVLGVLALATTLATWLGPWRHRVRQDADERELARTLVAEWGTDTLAPFALRADKSWFFAEDERALLAYRVVGGVAIVAGDPIGDPGSFPGLVRAFVGFARERGWRIAILGASQRFLPLYREHGLKALYHGDEAVLDVSGFSLEGRSVRKVRQSVSRLEKAGYTAQTLHPRDLTAAERDRLELVAAEWRGEEPDRGFVMALDDLFRLEDDDAVFVVGRNAGGEIDGFLHFAVSRAGSALSLSTMPRLRETPNGFNEWLVCEAALWARDHGFRRLSLNFAPFARLLAPEAELTGRERLQRRALLAMKGHFQLDNLLHFNRKFLPGWEPRYIVYERRADLPRVGIAALAAESYLPFASRARA